MRLESLVPVPLIRWLPLGVVVLLAALPGPASTHTFEVPEMIQAASDGSFIYEVVFTAGQEGADIHSVYVDGSENTDLGVIVYDGFCLIHLDHGEQDVLPIEGSLINLEEDGLVTVEYVICTFENFYGETVILRPSASVGEEQTEDRLPVGILGLSPNPCNEHVQIDFNLTQESQTILRVFDSSGRLVGSILEDALPVGDHQFQWDTEELFGSEQPNGAYFLQLTTDYAIATRRLVLLR